MSSSGRPNGNVSPDESRRPTRERRQAQHFGHSEPTADLEELIEASQPRTIAPAMRKGEATGNPSLRVTLHLPPSILSKATEVPSLWAKLPLPPSFISQPPPVHPFPSSSAPTIKIEDNSEAQAGPSSRSSRKRTAAPVDEDEDDVFAPSSSRELAPKRQRVRTSAPKPRVAPKAKAAVKVEEDDRPEPRGQPEVWAEERQALCEALPYYNALQSAAYSWGSEGGKGGFTYGFLLDKDHCKGSYMDENVVIARTGGGVKLDKKTGKMEKMGDTKSDSTLLNNLRDGHPVILLVGSKNENCPTKLPHRFNVMGTFHVTDFWPEKVGNSLVYRVRFEKIGLKAPSWWGVKGSALPTQRPDYVTKAEVHICSACGISSKQRYAPGWMCLNKECAHFSKMDGQAFIEPPAYNVAFINERNKWPANKIPPFPLKPLPPAALVNNPEMTTSHAAWKGMVCPDCGRCNSRTEWDEWKCVTEGCDFEIPIQHIVHPAIVLAPDHSFEAEGHAICFDKWEEPVIRSKVEFRGYWRKSTYELFPDNFISHYSANRVINRQPRGADEVLEALQEAKLGMKRHTLEHSPVEGDMLTRHFGANFGLPYKFVATPDSKAFSEAPQAIMDALNHVTWAGQDAIQDGSYRPFNELLCLGYMEDMKISFHDDGEKDLGPDIVSWSLGGAASMQFRIKSKHWKANIPTADSYDPDAWVLPGSQAWKMRLEVNEHYKCGRTAEYEASKADLMAHLSHKSQNTKAANGPVVLNLELRHGDMIVMHGERIQKIYEHGVKPKDKLRFGLTGRYIKPENIPVAEHWKGAFTIAPDKVYDGDLALFRANFPEDEED